MFGKRTTQKPRAELIREFQKKFSHVIADPFLTRAPLEHDDAKLRNTPIFPSQRDHLNHLPADPNVENVIESALHVGLHIPTANQMCAIIRSPAGDLHTPTAGWNLASRSSVWDRTVKLQPQPHTLARTATRGMAVLESQYENRLFQNIDPFAESHIPQSKVSFGVNSDYDLSGMSNNRDSYTGLFGHVTQPPPLLSNTIGRADIPSQPETPFRYRATLHAPTAIAEHAHESPVTYLNRSHTYSVSIVDSRPPVHATQPVKYRTSVRITFEELEHRSNPAQCWRLWKEVRGAVEAQQRGGKMRALEFVDLRMGIKKSAPALKQVDSASFDGFCVTWTGTPEAGCSECVVNVRLNFLSTDFSLSKGVKGVPTRLCVKTEMIGPEDAMPAVGVGNEAEICYCKVKVFREHGAERKLSNDVAHVQKAIHKVEKQIAQRGIDSRINSRLAKRKQAQGVGCGLPKNPILSTSLSSIRSNHMMGIDDLHKASLRLRELFSSQQPVSVLSLQGDVLDDLDQSPLSLAQDFSTPVSLGRGSMSVDNAVVNFHSGLVETSGRRFSRKASTVEPKAESSDAGFSDIQSWSSPESNKRDLSSRCQHVACFYVRFLDDKQQEPYYRAIYLRERTTSDFICQLSRKYKIQPDSILSLVHITPNNLRVVVDDGVVGEIPEGQDMFARFTEVPAEFGSDGRDDTEGYNNGYEVHLFF
ncbi:hypothetical protein KXV98_005460 [Aspergillus fumigatus]|nr:hypothetical protein KXV98_005460 [Aspergillus fumigatus]